MKKNTEIKPRIKEVAKNLFFTKGYNSVTTDDLAYELGNSKRTIYEHFKSKEEILDEVVIDMKTYMDAEFEKILNQKAPFNQIMKEVFSLMGQVSGYFKPSLLEDIRRYAPAVYARVNEIRKDSIQNKIKTMFEMGTQEGIFRNDINHDFLVFVFGAVFEHIATSDAFANMPITVGDAQGMFARMMFEGLYSKDFRTKAGL